MTSQAAITKQVHFLVFTILSFFHIRTSNSFTLQPVFPLRPLAKSYAKEQHVYVARAFSGKMSTSTTPIVTSTSRATGNDNNIDNKDSVNVNVVRDIDPLTITAVGFSLIAFNFFVFANLGE